MINIPKGTKDVLPNESYKWHYVEQTAREICRKHNIKEIRTPVFEYTELFERSVGETSDIVNKEMYTFLDKGNRSITLKPEGTAGVARSYIENSLDSLSLPLKMYYITPVFRYERPQAGRLREHHQFGIEIYGDPSYYMDYEVITVAYRLLNALGISKLSLNINSIGCSSCRAEYNKALKAYLASKIEGMCQVCKDRFNRNPLRILDCKEEKCKSIVKDAPQILDHLCTDCFAHFNGLKGLLTVNGYSFNVNPWIVRGLDYYNRTVFEFTTEFLGAQGTICGGGRYDKLLEEMGGRSTPCVGFGMGLERLIMLMDSINVPFKASPLDYFIMPLSINELDYSIRLCSRLRDKGYSVDYDTLGRSLKSQFKYAEKQGAVNVIVVGEDEVKSGKFSIKRLSDGHVEVKSVEEI